MHYDYRRRRRELERIFVGQACSVMLPGFINDVPTTPRNATSGDGGATFLVHSTFW